MKRIWAIRKDAEAVSPVIATILMVAITVVLAAVLYVMVLGFGGTSGSTPKLSISARTPTSAGDGYKFTLTKPTADTSWTDVTIILQGDNGDAATWSGILKASLTGTPPMTQNVTGDLDFWLVVTDMTGDGFISDGDYFTIVGGFDSGTEYTLTMNHETIKGVMVSSSFTV